MIIDREKIQDAKEALGDRNAFIMADLLNLQEFDEKNMKAICCFHDEDTPSLIYNPKNYTFHCFGCQKTVDIIDVYMQILHLTYIEAVQKLFEEAGIRYSFGEAGVRTQRQYHYPHEESKDNDMKQVYEYLESRHISKETADYADVRSDGKGNMVFNYYDTNDVLTMVKYRPAKKVTKRSKQPKCWCQPGADTSHLLFNMNRINVNEPLILNEGEGDSLAAIESGFHNAVSVPLGAGNFQWIEHNWEWLNQFSSIIICADNDEAGIKLQKEAVYRLGSWRTKIVNIPYTVKSKTGKQVAVKDLNEVLYHCGKDAVIDLISNASDTPIPSLIDFSDIKEQDLLDMDGIETGITAIDKAIVKFFYGNVNIVTGTPGAGKTSFLCQLIAQAIDAEKPVWLFSRELPEWMTKNWIEHVMAGRRSLTTTETPSHTLQYRVASKTQENISEYYRGLLKIYRNDFSNTVEDIETSMVDSARKYGSKLFILDNLMMINFGEDNRDLFDNQTKFMNWLIDFALKYNVVVVLVCHPRKLQKDDEGLVSLDDIKGSSNLGALTQRAFTLKRVSEKEKEGTKKYDGTGWMKKPIKYDVLLTIIKDRMTGKLGHEIGLYFDKPSRRFFTNPKEYGCQYGWDKTKYTDELLYPVVDKEDEIFGKTN